MKKPPSRTCLGCRRVRPKAALVRLVRLPNGTVIADFGTRVAGRGAYVCPDSECIERALGRGRLAHAFKQPSEASSNLAAVVLAAGRCEGRDQAIEPSHGPALLCDAVIGASRRDDVITVRA